MKAPRAGLLGSLAKGLAGRPRAVFGASVVAAALIWSTSYTATKVALAEVPPLTIGALRFLLAAMVLGGVVWICGKLERPGTADLGRLALGGVLGTTIYFSMENIGVDLATASDAALLVAAYPAITMGLEIFVYRASASWVRFVGVGLAMFGVYLIVGQSPQVGGENRFLGDVILVATGVIWTFYNFSTRRVGQSHSMLTVVFYQTAAGALAFAPLAMIERQQWQIPSPGSVLIVAYLAVFCSVVAFLLYAYGLKELDAGSAVNLLNLVPVFGVGFAFLVLQEPVGLAQLFGGAVVIAGVTLGLRSGGRQGRPASSEIRVAEVNETEEDKVYGERPG